MKKMKGFSTLAAVGVVFGSALLVVILYVVASYVKAYDMGVNYEQNIKAAWENNENLLSGLKLKITNAVSTSKLNATQVTELIQAANRARYGDEGSKASWQWLQENNLQLDQSINKQILQIVESSQNDFQAAQTRMIDTKRAYSTALEKAYPLGQGWWLNLAGFPRIDLKDYEIISSQGARDAFESGIDAPMQF